MPSVVVPSKESFHYDLLFVLSGLCLFQLDHTFLSAITHPPARHKVCTNWREKNSTNPSPQDCDNKANHKQEYAGVETRATHFHLLWPLHNALNSMINATILFRCVSRRPGGTHRWWTKRRWMWWPRSGCNFLIDVSVHRRPIHWFFVTQIMRPFWFHQKTLLSVTKSLRL